MEPFAGLSPAVAVIDLNRQSTLHLLGGRSNTGRDGYLRIVERLDQPDGAGIQGSDHNNMRAAVMWAIGTVEVQSGVKSGTRWADAIEPSPLFEVNAWRLRLVNAIRQADLDGAEHCKRQLEILKIQNRPTQIFEGSYLATLAMAYAGSQDFARIKELLPDLEAMAAQLSTWAPCLHYARGAYQAYRGDHEHALLHFEEGLMTARPGRHVMWAPIAGLFVTSLFQLGRIAEAKERGDQLLKAAERAGIETISTYLKQPMALVEAALGHFDVAVAYAEGDIERLASIGANGVVLGSIYETRARVAIAMDDEETFMKYAELCAAEYRVGQNPPLTAKFERLFVDARAGGVIPADTELPSRVVSRSLDDTSSKIATMLSACHGPRERAERALRLLLENAGLKIGYLYTMQQGGPALTAHRGTDTLPVGLDIAVTNYLSRAISETDEAMQTATQADLAPEFDMTAIGDERFFPMLLGHEVTNGYAVTGAAIVRIAQDLHWTPPYSLLSALSRSLMEAGDVQTVMVSL